MDLKRGYWRIEVDKRGYEKTAFVAPDGLHKFNVLPFGLCSAPATFQTMVAQLFIEYLDDVVMFAVTFEEHLKRLEMVLKALCSVYLGLKAEKCHLGYEELKFLGHVVSADSVWPDPDKTSTVAACPVPSDHLAHHLIKLAWICLDPLPCQPMETSRL